MSDLQCPARILLARHAQAAYAVPGVLTDAGGWLTDVGRGQARALAVSLRGERVCAAYTSPQTRAQRTGEIAAGVLGVPSAVVPGLQEFAVGSLGGSPGRNPIVLEVFSRWDAGDLTARCPGGESGEEVVARMAQALGTIADRHRGETVLVVSHGGAMRLAVSTLATNVRFRDLIRWSPANAEVLALDIDSDGWRVVSEQAGLEIIDPA